MARWCARGTDPSRPTAGLRCSRQSLSRQRADRSLQDAGFFAELTRQRLKRRVFNGIVDLQGAINRYLAETNDNPKPFTWTADPDAIIEKIRRGKQALELIY
jgi:hypothetical protein